VLVPREWGRIHISERRRALKTPFWPVNAQMARCLLGWVSEFVFGKSPTRILDESTVESSA
jgi:hypothetical protein